MNINGTKENPAYKMYSVTCLIHCFQIFVMCSCHQLFNMSTANEYTITVPKPN